MPAGATVTQETTVLETRVPLSQSVIWQRQRDFYARRGLKAWTEDLVPSYITNNPFIAEIYAAIVAAFIDDCQARGEALPISPGNPLRILELGAGTGKFAYLFLQQLTGLLRERQIAPESVRYSMTDCSEDLLAAWRSNRYLARFVASGVLEFELSGAGEESQLSRAGSSSAGHEVKSRSPLVVIANYVFDSLPQDAFIIQNGVISEALISTSAGPGTDGNIPPLSSLQLSFSHTDVPAGRYPDKLWNEILERYRSRLSAATVFFPAAALYLLERLAGSTTGPMLVLAADKGLRHEDDLALRQGSPELEFHASGQCFSTLVNFDAIARHYWGHGGEAFLPQKHFSSLNLCAFLQHAPEQEFPSTRAAYRETAEAFGLDDLFALMSWLDAHLHEISLIQALAILRLTRWDSTALLRLLPVIATKLRNAHAERLDLRDAILRTSANHFPVSQAENLLAFNCGVVLLELRFFAEAQQMFQVSEQLCGRSAATSYNLGLCALGLDRNKEALAFMSDACAQDSAFEPARNARLRLEQELAQSAKGRPAS
jgi:putative S-adenosyl-L-methionine-dependent methyltransferase